MTLGDIYLSDTAGVKLKITIIVIKVIQVRTNDRLAKQYRILYNLLIPPLK